MKKLTRDRVVPTISAQYLLTDSSEGWATGVVVFAEVGQQEEHASQSFLAGVEEVVDQVLFNATVPLEEGTT